MASKHPVLKWFLIMYLVALLPPLPYIIGSVIIFAILFRKIFGIFKFVLPMPSLRTYMGLIKRQYMVNKIRQGGAVE